ncbi:DUF4267 domain-containing protein [Actinomadura atramentaria]|uniref:DUF4267 domain-containing protein n=1 Tax=Actinomadura atramentaria TaxID=1990 RepID=UPI00036CF30E|nr:DUF4267 domain-containing protein [Actinomadura atramentaria]
MTTTELRADHADTRSMVIIHKGFRRESRLLGELVAAVRPGDVRRARAIVAFMDDYRAGLHMHHTGEDELLWPLLLARVDLDAEIVLRMEEQHSRVEASLAAVAERSAAWRASASAADRDALVAALAHHRTVLIEHLDDEETNLLPLAERHLTAAEWDAQGEHFVATATKMQALTFLGVILEDATPEERAMMLGGLPGPVRLIWKTVGQRRYANLMRRVRTGDAPSRVGTAIAVAAGLGIGYVGLSYLIAPGSTAPSFGLPAWPHGEAEAFLRLKGVRDLASGLITFALLARGEHRALGWTFLATAVIPAGDALTILTNHGSTAAALGIHGLTAAAVALGGALLVRSTRRR